MVQRNRRYNSSHKLGLHYFHCIDWFKQYVLESVLTGGGWRLGGSDKAPSSGCSGTAPPE